MRIMGQRVAGRLKLCTRGLIFEPSSDSRSAIVRFPFKAMVAPLEHYDLAQGSAAASGLDPASLFSFGCRLCIDLETGGRVAPFVTHDFIEPRGVVFQLQHSHVADFLALARDLQAIEAQRSSFSDSRGLLKPIMEARLGGGGGGPHSFELRHLRDFSERLLLAEPVRCDRIRPLVRHPGLLMVTDGQVYFQPSAVNNHGEAVAFFPLRRVASLARRRHMLRQTGLELNLDDGATTAFFNFESPAVREKVMSTLLAQPAVAAAVGRRDLRRAVEAWQRGELSNFEYLAFLNSMADRSVHDLTQYPVYPWVVADYSSAILDLESPATFRDLSKPVSVCRCLFVCGHAESLGSLWRPENRSAPYAGWGAEP